MSIFTAFLEKVIQSKFSPTWTLCQTTDHPRQFVLQSKESGLSGRGLGPSTTMTLSDNEHHRVTHSGPSCRAAWQFIQPFCTQTRKVRNVVQFCREWVTEGCGHVQGMTHSREETEWWEGMDTCGGSLSMRAGWQPVQFQMYGRTGMKTHPQSSTYPLLTLQKSNAICLYEYAFSLRYFAYLLMNVDMS